MDTYSKRLDPAHRDYLLLTNIEQALVRQAGGWEKFCVEIPRLLRQAIDEVIDSYRSSRFTVAELEKTEKTYLGTKIEILLRKAPNVGNNYLDSPTVFRYYLDSQASHEHRT
jgi:Restriction endonuclease NaeI